MCQIFLYHCFMLPLIVDFHKHALQWLCHLNSRIKVLVIPTHPDGVVLISRRMAWGIGTGCSGVNQDVPPILLETNQDKPVAWYHLAPFESLCFEKKDLWLPCCSLSLVCSHERASNLERKTHRERESQFRSSLPLLKPNLLEGCRYLYWHYNNLKFIKIH